MKKTFPRVCSFLLISLILVSTVASSSLAYTQQPPRLIKLDGNILYVGGSGPGNYTTIQDAIDNASEGDTVFVYSGVYEEHILITKSIQLIGIQNSTTIIDGVEWGTVVTINAKDTILKGFTIQNAKSDIQAAGIKISNTENVSITENIIQNNPAIGIFLQGPDTKKITIIQNTIRNNSFGIYIFNCPQSLIQANTINNNQEGVYIVGSIASAIDSNTISNRGLGIHIENSYNVLINRNWAVNNANGVYAFNSSDVVFSNNTIGWNRWYGLWTKDCSENTINQNEILGNVDVGLFLESSYDTTVSNNIVWDNDNGIYLKDSAGNLIQKNNLRNDKVNGCFVAHTLLHRRNIWKMNYWERARLFPYPVLGYIKLEKTTISWINIDWAPLSQPPQPSSIKKLTYQNSILYVGGNGPNNYSSIQAAINDAQANDTIYVFNGTYYEAVLINKPLQLVGADKITTLLLGNGTRDILSIQSDYVTIKNFSIQDGHFNILVNHSSYVSIKNNDIGSGLHGVSIQNDCHNIAIDNNSFLENVYGLRIFYSTETTISNNNFYSFKINAFYFGTKLSHGLHHWSHNYWEEAHSLPYLIHGKIRIGDFSLIWFNIDWTPRTTPL
ncbi:MAG: right-handed parallel beta-helix repeat-containing protein [Candidatus Thermoplasmatota archaeon]|jgi:parallel beta-helix repeat protein|nr:right-handed parallel beta-helix repeat-containing protein [Candidatus Thermoplasmatota archaeon]